MWVFEESSFVPCAKIKNGKTYSIITDHLGTPTQMYNDEGESVWEQELDMYGKVRRFANKDYVHLPFRYQGQYYDKEIDLCYNRFRYYDPEIGRYISEDPIGFISGELNFYNYVSDCNSWIDIFGLKPCYSDMKAQKKAEAIIEKYGGKLEKDGHYRMPNRRAARQAASEIAGNMGNNPQKITKGDFRDGPSSWKDNPSKIGQQSQDKSSGWRDDVLGHDFGEEKIGPHVNAWNNSEGIYSNLHLLY